MKDENLSLHTKGTHLVFVFSSGSLIFYIAARPSLDIEQPSTLLYSSEDLHKANCDLGLLWFLTMSSEYDTGLTFQNFPCDQER